MKSALIAVLMLGVGAWGQAPCPQSDVRFVNAPCDPIIGAVFVSGVEQVQIGQQVVHPKAPQCPKYQHWIFDECHGEGGMWACPTDPSSGSCVDTMHSVTEREWQELLEREARLQNALEHLTSAMEHQANFNDKLIKGMEKIGNARVTVNGK